MPGDLSVLFRSFSTRAAAAAVAALLATTSAGIAAPRQTALVENIIGHPIAVEIMDYLDGGQIIRLGPHDTIVLSYLHSCVRETITGGTVRVGIDRSEVEGGKVTRTTMDCGEPTFVLTRSNESQFAGRVLRGLKPEMSDTLAGGPDEKGMRN